MAHHHWINFIHSLSSAILIGAGIGTACVMYYGHRSRNVQIIAAIARYVVWAGWGFIVTAMSIQLMTGAWLAHLGSYRITPEWMVGSVFGYAVLWLCLVPIIYLQIKMRDFAIHAAQFNTKLPQRYYLYFRYWTYLNWPALLSVLIIFYMMTNKPTL